MALGGVGVGVEVHGRARLLQFDGEGVEDLVLLVEPVPAGEGGQVGERVHQPLAVDLGGGQGEVVAGRRGRVVVSGVVVRRVVPGGGVVVAIGRGGAPADGEL